MALLSEDIQLIVLNYDIGGLIEYTPLSEGTVQSNYKIKTTSGTFVLKHYTSRTYEQVLFEYSLIQYLIKNKFPTAAIVLTNDRVLQEYKSHPYIIYEYVEGQHIQNPGEGHIKQVIEKMGLLHSLTEGMKFMHANERLTYTLNEMTRLVKEKASCIDTANARDKLNWWLNEAEQLTLPDEMTRGICHTDYNPTNIIFDGNELKALIDFDDANYTYRCFDIISFITFFDPAFDHDTWQEFDKEDVLDFSEAKCYVKLYDDTYPMSEEDKIYLYDLLKFITLIDCVWYFERGNHQDFYERKKMEALNELSREDFYAMLFME